MSSSKNTNFSKARTPPVPTRPLLPVLKARRCWTREEDDAFIIILKKLVVDGWRQENAFRQGYLEVIWKELNVMFPGTDLTSTNARSKLTVWKKEYYIVLNMINTSGFGWNDSSNQISVSDDVWEEYVKTHSAVKDFREKSYRYFHDWVEIFGKDRATGKNSQGPEDLEKVAKEVPPANEELYVPHFDATIFNINQNEDPYIPVSHFDENIGNDFPYDSVPIDEEITDTPSPGECNSSININKRAGGKKMESFSSKKRSRLETNSKEPIIVNLMDQFFKQQNESIGIFVDKLGMNKQPEEVDKTKLVLEALSKMGTLTEENKLYFAYKIATDVTVMNLFLNFSEGERITFVNMMMTGKI
ncbi:hypothetical protein OROHE_002329 [Orobanche hederae]